MQEERYSEGEQRTNSIDTNSTNLAYSCIIDRNQIIKNTFNKSNQHTAMLMSNMNLYYDLIKSIPELSRMDIK